MRHNEFWSRMEEVLGPVQCRLWAESTVMSALGGRTAVRALADGMPPREVWAAVGEALDLPAKKR